MAVRLTIVGVDPPGRTPCGAGADGQPHVDVHLGVQRRGEVVDLVPGDQEARFELDLEVRGGRFAGPFVHGRGDERFVYLSWGDVVDGGFRMFRRAKLQLDHLAPAEVDGQHLEARLSLTDPKGGPVCASVRPPVVAWRVVGTASP